MIKPLVLSIPIVLLGFACSQSPDQMAGLPAHIHVPEGYTVEMAAGPELLDYPMFATLDERGRLFVFESTGNVYEESQDAIDDPQFRIKLLQDLDGDGRYDTGTIFADKLSFPQGGVFHGGSLIASSAPDLLKLTDTDDDGIADQREVLLSGWILNVNANSLIGPFMGPDGWLYMTNAIMGFDVTSREGERMKGETARIWRVQPDGSSLEWVSAGGMNNPVELAFTPAAEVIGTQTFFVDPQRGLRDALTFWVEGGVYGKKNDNIQRDALPLTGELLPVVSQYSRVAPAGIGVYRSDLLGSGFEGNLFSAQFNTHAVIRHRLYREGASFRTEDEIFFHSDSGDFHPTDVLEDADGSLLVVETGGWFILGCPLSQISKPQLKGGIYRIRREDAPRVEDPYGEAIPWSSLQPAELAAYLADERPFVADRAGTQIVSRGPGAVGTLAQILNGPASEDARTRTVFALYRIGTEEALASVRMGLSDDHLQVRVAAARAAGLAKDRPAVDRLIEMVQTDEPAARRQAATALGQIGDDRSVSALLEAAGGADDRFVQHAAIYALIDIERPDLLVPALHHASPKVREVALIALDQMPESPLRADQITSFLTADEPALQQRAMWVASHHPEWSEDLIAFLEYHLNAPSGDEEWLRPLEEILTNYCADPQVQAFMASQLQFQNGAKKLMILDSMSSCRINDLPEIWIDRLGNELAVSGNALVKSRVIELIRLRGITSLDEQLRSAADNESYPPAFRIDAIDALLENDALLSPGHFSYLFQLLTGEQEAPLLQRTASVLARAALTESQLEQLGTQYIPDADPFILPYLMPAFEGSSDPAIGNAWIGRLMDVPNLDNYTETRLEDFFESFNSELEPQVEQLLEKVRQVRSERLRRLTELESRLTRGSIERGRALYFGKAICWTCHAMRSEGGDLGPDLTSIQHDRTVHDILEAIVYPGVGFARDYETYEITTPSGTQTGIIKEQSPEAVTLATGPQTSIRISRDDILSISSTDVSLMPSGLDQLLTEQEFADLLAFLLGQDLVY